MNTPNLRKPLTGQLAIRVMAIKDVDHATTGRFSRGPETFVAIKVEDNIVARTKMSRNDRWEADYHTIDVDKANEVELTVYDKPSEHPLPIGMIWVRISDIVEEMRRKRIEAEMSSSGWVSADRMGNNGQPQGQPGMPGMPGGMPPQYGSGGNLNTPGHPYGAPGPQTQVHVGPIDGWFNLEPAGQIQLQLSFVKQNHERRPVDLGLGRKGAVRQRKEEVHEMYGHKFVQQQFYNIMRCAFCGEFLKSSAGMQCEDCKYTCHTKCYPSVVTKCISKSHGEQDPAEETINHRIPHRFQTFANVTANWCCHCGYILPLGRKNCRKCAGKNNHRCRCRRYPCINANILRLDCSLTCHTNCAHLVPDFCGMSMAVASELMKGVREAKLSQTSKVTSIGGKTLRSDPSNRRSSSSTPKPAPTTATPEAVGAAQRLYEQRQNPPQSRPAPVRAPSDNHHPNAAAAAAAALRGSGQGQSPSNYEQPKPQPLSPTNPAHRPYNPSDYARQQRDEEIRNAQQPRPGQHPGYPPYQQPGNNIKSQLPQQPPPEAIPSYLPVQPHDSGAGAVARNAKKLPSATDSGTGMRIGLDNFNFLAVLGKGNFGKVMLAEAKQSKKLYAIKVLKKEFIIEHDEVESMKSEKRVFLIANKDRHPFLTNLSACFQTETRVYFVMEYISGGDLMLHIQRGQFGAKRAQFYAAEVCLALKYFHENGVVYRDLKLDNIMLTLDGHVKVADYGLCKEEMWYGSTTGTFCGTPEFMAPEILLDKKYGRAVDWWAFGVLIYQMLLQQSPFRGEDEDEIYDAILADEPLYPIHMPRDSVSMLQKLLTRDPEQRLGSGANDAQDVMNEPFFRNINWDDIYHKRVQPPFLPQIKNATDTSNFDSEFTSVTPVLTPVQSVLSQAMQEEFRGFSYTAQFQ